MQEFDVIICGAGPAGSTCALGLFDAGLKVALIDKESFPRSKVCGDAYGGYAYKILNTISPAFGEKILNYKEGVIAKRAKFISPKGYQLELKLKGFFSNLPRYIFDDFLLQIVKDETKTIILQNTFIQKVEINNDDVIAITNKGEKLKSKIIVGCDGAQSIVRTALTYTREPLTETCPSLRAYFKNVKEVENDCLEIHLLNRIPKGYFWIFPSLNGTANVGIGADKEIVAKHKINLRQELLNIIKEEPQFKQRFLEAELLDDIKGWTIPIGLFNSKLPISGNRVLLCGDAAALADPATGEGIGPAMSSGRYAAQQIKKCFNENNFSAAFLKNYDKQIKKKYARNYWIKSTITNLYYKFPVLMDWAVYIIGKINRLI